VERDRPVLARGGAAPRVVRAAGGEDSLGAGRLLRRREPDLPRARRAGQPSGPRPAAPGSGAGGAGGVVPGALGRDGGGPARHPQGRRSLRAPGS
jgi:hypothetical protein